MGSTEAIRVAQKSAAKRDWAQRLGISLVRGGKVQRSDLVMALVLFLPGFLVLLFLGVYPVINVLSLAFQKQPMFEPTAGTWVGTKNLSSILASKIFWIALRNDIVFTINTVVLQTLLGLVIALLLHQRFFGRNVFRSVVLFSYVFPIAAAAIIWRFMLSDCVGIIYHFIRVWKLPIPNTWFSSVKTAMPSVIMVAVWKYFPFMVITFLARLQTIDEELYDAAKVDGASSWQRFRNITLPMLMPVVSISMLLRTIWTFNNWEIIALLTGGGPINTTLTLPVLVYGTVFSECSIGRAAGIAFLMMLVLLIAMVFFLRMYERAEEALI
ncbi:MAG: carbohydrate ABC transporter permease [Anaerolineae bacterium]